MNKSVESSKEIPTISFITYLFEFVTKNTKRSLPTQNQNIRSLDSIYRNPNSNEAIAHFI